MSIEQVLGKYKNQLAELWQCEQKYPVKALEYKNQAVESLKGKVWVKVGERELAYLIGDEIATYNDAEENIGTSLEDYLAESLIKFLDNQSEVKG